MSSRRRIGLVSRRQRDRLIRQEADNLMNEIDSADSDSTNSDHGVEIAVPDVPMHHMIQAPIEPFAVQYNEIDSDLEGDSDDRGDDDDEDVNDYSEDGDGSEDDVSVRNSDDDSLDGHSNGDHNGDSDEEVEIQEQENFKDELAKWVRKNCIARDATNDLLKMLLINGHPDLPTTRETLLKTPRLKIAIRDCPPGKYFHYGIEKSLIRSNYSCLFDCEIVEIDINVDGLSLSRSSNVKVWPILGALVNQPNTSPFIFGVYEGDSNPKSIDNFLEDFVNELQELLQVGVKVTRHQTLKPLVIRTYICDAPARAFLVGSKGFGCKTGCDKCEQISVNKKYSTVAGQLRTDQSFRDRRNPHYHKPEFLENFTLLEILGTRMVSQVVPDPMHLLDEGVFKRMTNSLLVNHCPGLRLGPAIKNILDATYISYSAYVPAEFKRKPRSFLAGISKWTGSESRFGLLYGFVVLLRDKVGPVVFYHFLKLFVALRYLSSPSTYLTKSDEAQRLLNEFVAEYPQIYGPSQLVYNVHMLLHIVNEARKYGPLYTWSAYRFENHMREIKKLVRKPGQILEQIYRRLEEIHIINETHQRNGFIGNRRPYRNDFFPGCNSSFRGFQFDAFILKSNLQDSCCFLRQGIPIEIQEFVIHNGVNMVIAKPFTNIQPFFGYPADSLIELGILLVDGVGDEINMFPVDQIKYKYVRLPFARPIPYSTKFVLLPMLHHLIDEPE